MATSTLKSEIRKEICDPKHSMRNLIDTVKINEYLNAVSPKDKNIVMYGVNVRLKGDADIMPFVYVHAKKKYDASVVAENIQYTAPNFINGNSIKDIYFSCKITKKNKIDKISILLCRNAEGKKKSAIKGIRKLLNQPGSFLIKNLEALGFKAGSDCYVWIAGEDFDPESGGEMTLSNILAISNNKSIIENLITKQIQIEEFLFLLKSKYLIEVDRKRKIAAEKSAKAAIMSRNMSHNLGSHVMAYLKQHLNSVQDMIRDNVLSQIIMPNEIEMNDLGGWKNRLENTLIKNIEEIKEQKRKNGVEVKELESAEQVKEVALPFLVGLGKFISYLQERQDFIATIATAYTPYFSQVNFKDFIYDELNPDLRYERHSDRIGMKPDNILLGNIARSEGLARVTQPTRNKEDGMSDIILQFRSFDGHIPSSEQQSKDLDLIRKVNLSLPGGVVGRQAFFSIIENIIRNAAKHGSWGGKKGNDSSLKLLFDIYEKKDILEGNITDDDAADASHLGLLSFLRKYYLETGDMDDVYIITITDNMQFEAIRGEKWSKYTSLNKALIEPYIDEQGAMVNSNKGIKEMRISAAWMRGLDERDVQTPINSDGSLFDKNENWTSKNAPILLARPSKNAQEGISNLQYIICILKPKRVAIITKNHDISSSSQERERIKGVLNEYSCKAMSMQEFIEAPNKSYDFVLFNDVEKENGYSISDYDSVRKLSHNRIVRTSAGNVDLALLKSVLAGDKKAIVKLIENLHQLLAHYSDGECIYIDDEKTDTKYNIELKEDYPKSLVHISKDYDHVYDYMYRTHHETEQIFSRFMSNSDLSELKKSIFVEGITGNNSTDRLVRNDIINNDWFYKHLRAMKSRIAVVDERIFSKVYRREEKELGQDVFENLSPKQIKEILRAVVSNESNRANFTQSEFRTIKEKESLISFIREHNILLTDADFSGIQYDMKGVNIFTIIKKYDSKNFPEGLDIYGYWGYLPPDEEFGRNSYRSIIGRVGHISMDEDSNIVVTLYNKKYLNCFDYISIHQGILDKVYEHLGVKRESEIKHKITLELYKTLIQNPNDYLIDNYEERIEGKRMQKKGYFLPKLMIHSGRSKPSFSDMPQKQPFIQYSAVEHAVLDCKYSLVELLDYARYEQEQE